MKILLTGGLGYIGSHTCVCLKEAGHDTVVIDNLCNSKISVKDNIEKITGSGIAFYEGDIRDRGFLRDVFQRECRKQKIDAVIHFAGHKAVAESVEEPIDYFENNIAGTIDLLAVMEEEDIRNLIFSSSATVYNPKSPVPYKENDPKSPVNPYGETKYIIERMLCSLAASKPSWNIVILRYFNPAGAHKSGLIGEDPGGIPNNLFPYILKAAKGELPALSVFGNDYPTPDGTGVRDYIHVSDLAEGHMAALKTMLTGTGEENPAVYNLGTGRGYSVLEIIEAFEKTNNIKVPYRMAARRTGDIAWSFASTEKAKKELHWETKRSIYDMCRDLWRFGHSGKRKW